MRILVGGISLLLLAVVLWDAFEIILLPRRTPSGLRVSRTVLRNLWRGWSAIGRRIEVRNQRESFLALYALLSLIGLLAVWAAGLVLGFAGLYVAAGSQFETGGRIVMFRRLRGLAETASGVLQIGFYLIADPTVCCARRCDNRARDCMVINARQWKEPRISKH